MTTNNLTEKWKNRELPEGYYYIRNKAHSVKFDEIDYYMVYGENRYWHGCEDEDIEEVLAPVPSYAEYMILVSYKEELTKACKMRDKIIKKYQDIDTWWKAENQKLKELLKECREEISDEIDDCTDPRIELFAKIDEVLK